MIRRDYSLTAHHSSTTKAKPFVHHQSKSNSNLLRGNLFASIHEMVAITMQCMSCRWIGFRVDTRLSRARVVCAESADEFGEVMTKSFVRLDGTNSPATSSPNACSNGPNINNNIPDLPLYTCSLRCNI